MTEERLKAYEAKIVKNGTGLHIHVPSYMVKYMDLKKGDKVKVDLTMLERIDKNGSSGI